MPLSANDSGLFKSDSLSIAYDFEIVFCSEYKSWFTSSFDCLLFSTKRENSTLFE